MSMNVPSPASVMPGSSPRSATPTSPSGNTSVSVSAISFLTTMMSWLAAPSTAVRSCASVLAMIRAPVGLTVAVGTGVLVGSAVHVATVVTSSELAPPSHSAPPPSGAFTAHEISDA